MSVFAARRFQATLLVALAAPILTLCAQDTARKLEFDSASVKANRSGREESSYSVTPGAIAITNYQLKYLIARAYDMPLAATGYKMTGGPRDIMEARFDIRGRAGRNAGAAEIQEMTRNLLAQRFALRVRNEVRRIPAYALVQASKNRFGPEFAPSSHNCTAIQAELRARGKRPADGVESPRDSKGRALCWVRQIDDPTPRGAWRLRSAGTLAELIRSIQGYVDRPVIDTTGLTGNFEWQLVMNPVSGLSPRGTEWPSVFTALEQQLGLKLMARTMPYEMFVIDRVEPPTDD